MTEISATETETNREVIRRALTCPIGFPEAVQDAIAELLTVAPQVLRISEKIGRNLLPIADTCTLQGDDATEAFCEATG